MFIRENPNHGAAAMTQEGIGKAPRQPEILARINAIQASVDELEKDAHAIIGRVSPVTRDATPTNSTSGIAPQEDATTELSHMLLAIQRRIEAIRFEIADTTQRIAL